MLILKAVAGKGGHTAFGTGAGGTLVSLCLSVAADKTSVHMNRKTRNIRHRDGEDIDVIVYIFLSCTLSV